MCKNVSYFNLFKRLFGRVCDSQSTSLLLNKKQARIHELLEELEDEHNNYNSLFQKYIESNSENNKLIEALTKTNEKTKHYDDLLAEHKKLRELYETLNARIHKSVTSISLQKCSKPSTNTESLHVGRGTIDRILEMKRQKKGYEKIATTLKLSVETVKELYIQYK